MEILPGKICTIVAGELHGRCKMSIRRIVIDSRKFIEPEGSLFIALKGDRNDGHHYLHQLIEHGVKCFIVQGIS